jgi:hypothetical protein
VNVSHLPTDSLYKFSAIVGTLLVLLSTYFPFKLMEEMQLKLFEAEKQQGLTKVDLDFLERKRINLELTIEHWRETKKKGYRPDPNKIYLRYSEAEIKQMQSEVMDLLRENMRKGIETKAILRTLDRLYEVHTRVCWAAVVGVILGLLLAMYGYVNWYRKIQVHQDRLMKESTYRKGSDNGIVTTPTTPPQPGQE